MSYIGSPPSSQAFAPGTDTFSGTGSQTAFTLSRNVATVNDILVVVNNVDQQPSNYSVANNILTFSPAPSAGTNNIYVRYLSTNLQTIAPQQGSVVISSFSATGTPSASTFLRGDNAWANPVSAGSIGIAQLSATGSPSATTFLRGDNTWDSVTVAALSTASGSAPSYSARAWVNFNGTGAVGIRASGNVTSITDNGTGDYTVNFTTALTDANYSSNITASFGSTYAFAMANTNSSAAIVAPTTTTMRFAVIAFNASAFQDCQYLHVAIFR
jgi:hypothetical protein